MTGFNNILLNLTVGRVCWRRGETWLVFLCLL